MDIKTEQSRNRYNQIADNYDESFDGRFTQPYNQFLCDYLPLVNGDSVLDVACGNGRLLRMFSQKAHINAYGIDVSEEMITAAQKVHQDAVYRVSFADSIDFPDNTFDYVTVCCAFHHFTKPDAFMKEAFRVLKRNGMLCISDPSPVAVIRWIENLIIPLMKMGDVRLYKISEFYRFFKQSGFEKVSHLLKNGMITIAGRKG